jgi:hypothetical protein
MRISRACITMVSLLETHVLWQEAGANQEDVVNLTKSLGYHPKPSILRRDWESLGIGDRDSQDILGPRAACLKRIGRRKSSKFKDVVRTEGCREQGRGGGW